MVASRLDNERDLQDLRSCTGPFQAATTLRVVDGGNDSNAIEFPNRVPRRSKNLRATNLAFLGKENRRVKLALRSTR